MTHSRSLTLAAWILTAACSGGDVPRGEAPEAGTPSASADQPAAGAARGRAESFSAGTVPMKVSGSVARYSYQAEGTGQCATSADGSIYETPATLWHAIFEKDGNHLNLVVWRPKSGGPDMVSFNLTSGVDPHRISTVKGGELLGEGTPTVQPAGSGGTLSLKGRDEHGHIVEMTVECARFEEQVAEGG